MYVMTKVVHAQANLLTWFELGPNFHGRYWITDIYYNHYDGQPHKLNFDEQITSKNLLGLKRLGYKLLGV